MSGRFKSLLLLVVAGLALGNASSGEAVVGGGASSVVVAVADGYVRSDAPGSNYGRSTKLNVDASPITRSYLRFSVSGLAGPVTKATLRLYATSSQTKGFDVYGVTDTTWSETGITYANAPPLAVSKTGSSGPVGANTWIDVDVTDLVAGNGSYSFALTTADTKNLALASRETGADTPQLVIETAPSTDTAAPSVPGGLVATAVSPTEVDLGWDPATDDAGVSGYTIYRDGAQVGSVGGTSFSDRTVAGGTSYRYSVDAYDAAGNHSAPSAEYTLSTPTAGGGGASSVVVAVADGYVRSDAPGSNYGRSTKLNVDASPITRSYLRFSVSGVAGPVTKATLRLYATSSQTKGFDVYGVTDTTWSETGITYANAPPLAVSKTGSSGPVGANTWIDVDVTDLVAGNGSYSFALTTADTKNLALASRETGANTPQLVIEAPDTEAPSVPANLRLEGASRTTLTLAWDPAGDNVGVSDYQLYLNGAQVGATQATEFTFSGLAADTPYSLAVTAQDAAGNASDRAIIGARTAELTFPIRAAFYYPWFPQAWSQQGYHCGSPPPTGSPATPSGCFTNYYPTLGFYDPDADPTVYDRQIRAMQYGGIDAAISSWWGIGDDTDTHFSAMLSRADALGTGFKLAIYYEPEGSGNPTIATIQSQLAYFTSHYTGDPGYLRVGGKPVIFVYNADLQDDQTCATVDKWEQAAGSAWYVVMKIFPGALSCTGQPDAWHQYAPDQAVEHKTGWHSYAISPGFAKANETTARLPRDLTRWQQNVRDMVASGEPWQLVVSFNEWGEGTAVESATAQLGPFATASGWASPSGYGDYLDVLHSNGGT